jgi:hypothetical protein
MKKTTALMLMFFIIILTSCSTALSVDLSTTATIELKNGTTGDEIVVNDEDAINTICAYFHNDAFAKNGSAADSTGWSYQIICYDAENRQLADIEIVSAEVVKIEGHQYQANESVIDVNYLQDLFE